MSFVKIGEATHVVSGVTTLFELYEEGGTLGSESLKFTSTIREAGQIGRDILSWHLPTSVSLQATDTGRFLLTKFRDKAETDFRLDISKGGVLYNRVNLLLGSEQPQLGETNPVITIKGTDGILRLQSVNYDAETLEDTYPDGITVAELYQLLLDAIGHEIDTRVYLEVAHDNQNTTRPNAHGIRWAVRDWLEGEDSRTYYDVLGRLCEYYQLQVMQANGVWMVMERKYRGGPMDYANCAFGGSITKVAADDRQVAIGDSAIIRKSAKDPALQATPKVVSRNVFPEKELLNPRFEEWNVGITEPIGWTIPSAATLTKFTHGTTGAVGATLNASADGFNQKSGETLGASERIRVVIEFIDVQYDAAFTSGTISAAVGQLVLTNTLDATDRYLQADGTWSTTPGTTINRTFEAGESTPITIVVEAIVPVAGTPELFTRFAPNPNAAGIDEFDSWTYGEFSYERLTPSSISRQIEYEAVSASESTEEIIEEEFAVGDFDNYNTGAGVSEYLDLTSAAWTKTTNWGSSTLFHQNRVTNRLQQQATRLRGLDIELAPGTEITIADTISRTEFRVTTGGDFRVTTTGDFRVTNTGDYIPVYEREDFWTRVRRFVAYEHKSDSANADRKYDPGPAPTARPNPTYSVEFALRSDGYYDVYFVAERDENTACIEWEYLVNNVVVDSGVEEFGTARTVRVQANPSNSLDLADVTPTLRAWGWSDYNAGNARGLRQARTFERTDLYNIFPEADYAIDFRWPLWLYSPTSTDRPELYDVWLTWRYNPQVRAIEYDFVKTGGGTRSGVIDLDDPGPFTAGSTDAPSFTFTADAGTDVITATAHGLYDGAFVVLSTTGTLPAGLSQTTAYYLRDTTTNTFKLAASVGGAAIDITTAGTGTHTANTRIIGWNISRNDTTRQVQPGDEITITAKAWSGISGGVGTGTEEPVGSRFSRKIIVPDLGIPVYANAAGLQASSEPVAGKKIRVIDSVDNSTGRGIFVWDPASSVTEVPGMIYAPDSGGTGRYKRVYAGHLQSEWFGGNEDYATDASTELQAAINYAATISKAVDLGGKSYAIATGLNLTTGCKGLVNGKIKAITGHGANAMLSIAGAVGIEVRGVEFNANSIASHGIFASDMQDSLIEFNYLHTFGDVTKGIQLQGTCSGNTVRRNKCSMATSPGLAESLGISCYTPNTGAERSTSGDLTAGYYDTFTGTISAGALGTVNITTQSFVAGDVGKLIAIADAGAPVTAHVTTIATYVDPDTVTLVVAATTAVTNKTVTVINGTITRPTITVKRNKFIENECLNGTHGISLHYSDHNELIGNVCEAQQHRNYILTSSSYNKITTNRGLESESAGVSMAYGCEHNDIDGNKFVSNSVSTSGGVDGDAIHGYILCDNNTVRNNTVFSTSGTNPFIYGIYFAINSTNNQVYNNSVVGAEVGYAEETDWQGDLPAGAIYSRENSADQIHVPATGSFPQGYNDVRGNYFDCLNAGIYLAQVNNKSDVNPQELKNVHIDGNTITDRSTYLIYVYEETAGKVTLNKLWNLSSDATSTAKISLTRGRAHFNGARIENVALLDDNTFRTLAGVTPSVKFGRFFRASNGSATTITNFADGSEGQIIYVRFDGNTLVNHNASFIILAGEQPLEPESGEVKSFLYDNSIWREIGGLPNEFHHSLRMRDPVDAPYGFVIDIDSSDSSFSGTWSRHHAVNINGNTQVSFGAIANGGTLDYGFIGGDMASGDPGFGATDMWIKLFPTSMEVGIPNGALVLSDITAPGTTTNKLYSVAGALTWNGAAVQTGAAGNAFANITDGTTTAAADSVTDTFKLRTANSLLTIAVQNDDATHADNALFTINESSINHNNLTNYSANRHIDHSAVSISPGTGLTGGGTIAATRTLSIDVNATVQIDAIWTFAAGVKVPDSINVLVGTGNDFRIFHDGTNTYHDNTTGTFYFRQQVDGGTINIVCDDGGGVGQAVANFSAASGLNITTGNLLVSGTKVVGSQGAAVADASGGATVDTEARTALNALLARLRTHGLIAT